MNWEMSSKSQLSAASQITYELILASESPRRRHLLREAGFQFQVHPTKISENLEKNLKIDDQIIDVARRKARAAADELNKDAQFRKKPTLILAADTMVIHSQTPLGKPRDASDAFHILRRLSGTEHFVKTAVVIINNLSQIEIAHLEETKVLFRILTDQEIRSYIATGEPLDKAGAYGIQGLGGDFVTHYEGSLSNVIGLPIEVVVGLLEKKGWHVARK